MAVYTKTVGDQTYEVDTDTREYRVLPATPINPADAAALSSGQVDAPGNIADIVRGGKAAWGKILNAALPDYSPHKKDAQEMIAEGEKIQNPAFGAILPTLATAPLGGGLFKGGAALAEAALPAATSQLGKLAAASAARVGGGATAGAGLGALDTVGTDRSALEGAGIGALTGAGVQLPFELLPGAATALKAGRNAVLDSLKSKVPAAPSVDPQVLAAAQQRGFIPHSGKIETPEEAAARDLANRQQLGSQLGSLTQEAGGPLSQEAAATQVADRFRPALERFGRETGKGFDAFYQGKRVKLGDDQFKADVQKAIRNELSLPEPAQDKQFLRTAQSLLSGEVPNPVFEQILEQVGGNESRALEIAQRAGVAPTVATKQLQGFDPATGTVPIDVTRAAISKFGSIADKSQGGKAYGYGSLQGALKGAQERSLSPKDVEQLQKLRSQYKYFKDQESATPDKNANLLRLIEKGDTQTLDALRNVLDEQDFTVVQDIVRQKMLGDLQRTAQGGRPSVNALDPASVERAIAAIPDEAGQAFLPARSLNELGRISGEMLSPQENLLLRPTGHLGSLVNKLMGGAAGAAGAGVGTVLGGHPLAGYGIGKAVGQDRGSELVRKLLNKPTPALTETLPFLSSKISPQISNYLIQALMQGQ